MKKLISFLIVASAMLALGAGGAWAIARTYTVQTTMPSSVDLGIYQSQFTYDEQTGLPVEGETWIDPGTSLNFGTLAPHPQWGYWRSLVGFAIDIANNGNAGGAPNVQFQYSEGVGANNPNNDPLRGLGHKVVAGFNKLTYNTTDPTNPHHYDITNRPKTILSSIGGSTIVPSMLTGGWLRVYFGVYVTPEDEANAVPNAQTFTAADAPGTYRGTLTITATTDAGGTISDPLTN